MLSSGPSCAAGGFYSRTCSHTVIPCGFLRCLCSGLLGLRQDWQELAAGTRRAARPALQECEALEPLPQACPKQRKKAERT